MVIINTCERSKRYGSAAAGDRRGGQRPGSALQAGAAGGGTGGKKELGGRWIEIQWSPSYYTMN